MSDSPHDLRESYGALLDGRLVRRFEGEWELYDMEVDRTELHDLAPRDRRMVARMATLYEQWAQRTGVIDWRIQQPKLKAAWGMQDIRG